jgi:hypothetical protein
LLSRRFARPKNITLTVQAADASVIVQTDPLGLQMALFAGIETCLSVLPPDSTLRLRSRTAGAEAAVDFELAAGTVRCDAATATTSENWPYLEGLAKTLNGRLVAEDNRFFLLLPRSKPN